MRVFLAIGGEKGRNRISTRRSETKISRRKREEGKTILANSILKQLFGVVTFGV